MLQHARRQPIFRGLFTRKDLLLTSSISIGYLLLSKLLIGYKPEQMFLVFIFNILYYLSFPTRKFIIGFSVFIVFWIIFDYMKAFPNYRYNTVHIEDLYQAEKTVFGINTTTGLLTPNEYFSQHVNTFSDVVSGVFYLCWMPVPLFFAAYLFFTNRQQLMYFSLTFLFVNLLGFLIYYLFPAAPPWYVQLHTGESPIPFIPHTPGNTAGLHRFDVLVHAGIFKGLYGKSSNVFAAMPSLHSAYPVVVLYYGLKNNLGVVNLFFATVMVGIWFAAVYTGHHYLMDVLAGITVAILGIFLFNRLVIRNVLFQRMVIDRYVN